MADYTEQIESIYLAYYGRPADVTGLAYWNTALNTANGDLASIINSFGTAAEATAADAPRVNRSVELVNPNPIPSEPSISWAIAPAIAKGSQVILRSP